MNQILVPEFFFDILKKTGGLLRIIWHKKWNLRLKSKISMKIKPKGHIDRQQENWQMDMHIDYHAFAKKNITNMTCLNW